MQRFTLTLVPRFSSARLWRTRHSRLRGRMIRGAVDRGDWTAAQLEGVYMPADLGTKPLEFARFEDLLGVVGLHVPHLPTPVSPPNPKVAAIKTNIAQTTNCTRRDQQWHKPAKDSKAEMTCQVQFCCKVFLFGIGGYVGWTLTRYVHRSVVEICCRRRRDPVCSEGYHNPTRQSSRHVALLDLQPPQAATPAASRHVALLEPHSQQASTPAAIRPVRRRDLPPQSQLHPRQAGMKCCWIRRRRKLLHPQPDVM